MTTVTKRNKQHPANNQIKSIERLNYQTNWNLKHVLVWMKLKKKMTYVYPVQSSTWFDPWLTATTSHSAHWSAERSMVDVFSYNPSNTNNCSYRNSPPIPVFSSIHNPLTVVRDRPFLPVTRDCTLTFENSIQPTITESFNAHNNIHHSSLEASFKCFSSVPLLDYRILSSSPQTNGESQAY